MSNPLTASPTLALLSQGPTVSGLAEVEARTPEEIMDLLHQGNQSRTQQATRANAVSSRSHAVLQVRDGGGTGRTARFPSRENKLVDTERVTRRPVSPSSVQPP